MPRGNLAAWEQRRVADSSPRRFSSPNPPYSPIAATSLQNYTNILDYPASWRCLVPIVAVELPLSIRTLRRNPLGRTDNIGMSYAWILNTKKKIAKKRKTKLELKRKVLFFEWKRARTVNLSQFYNVCRMSREYCMLFSFCKILK